MLLGTFDSSNENWRYVTLSVPFTSVPTVSSTAAANFLGSYGIPPGSIGWDSTEPGGYQYWATPVAWSGSKLSYYGYTVTWNYWYYTPGSWNNAWGDIAIRTTSGTWLVADVTPTAPTMAPNATDNTVWNTLSVRLDPSGNWRVGSVSGSLATAAQIQNALANFDYLVIRAEVRTETVELMRMDNFRVVPEAGTFASMGAFLSTGLAWVWRRRQLLRREFCLRVTR